jgi:hypothetical protein
MGHHKHHKGFVQPNATGKGQATGTGGGKHQAPAVGKGHLKHHKK